VIDTNPADPDADALLAFAEANEQVALAADARRLQIAAAWADLHGTLDEAGRSGLPGAEPLVEIGGDGAPPVAEFAPAELGS
jgi:hypothetical protein